MSLPEPVPGLVIEYEYLWRHEHERGREHAPYSRPCAIVVAQTRTDDGLVEVVTVPLTTKPPSDQQIGVLVPIGVRRLLGLTEKSWIILNETNAFVWPGPGLRRNRQGEMVWGKLPPGFIETLRDALIQALRSGSVHQLRR